MDRVRAQERAPKVTRAAAAAAAVVVLVGGGVTLARIDFRSHRVDRTRLTIETVQQGTLEIKVRANGQLRPTEEEQLAARVAGRVSKTPVKPGAVVQAGQILVELTNPQLVTSADQAQSAWEGAVAELKASKSDLETQLLNQEAAFARVESDLEKTRVRAAADEALAKERLISALELNRSQVDFALLTKIHAIEKSRLEKARDNVEVQLAVKKFRVNQFARALAGARAEAADLKVVAGISGTVQAIDVEIGQQLQPGSPIGSIAQQDRLYAELRVPAREATQVKTGQGVLIDTRNGTVKGDVTRVAPGVTDGTVAVDVTLKDPLPAGARPQLQVEGIVYISRLPNTLYVGKPAYVKSDATIAVYKLDGAERYASRVNVKAGLVSLDYLQVLEGLQAGDRIITSETGEWQGHERILLK